MLNNDYRDMLRCLSDEGADFLLVGAYAMAVHGYPRATMDMDLWVDSTPANSDAVMRALARFGAPLGGLAATDLQRQGTVLQIGVAPRRIDILTEADGLEYVAARQRSHAVDMDGLTIAVLSLEDLITNKRATGRQKDLADVEALEALRPEE